MPSEDFDALFGSVKLRERIGRILRSEIDEPEGRVRARWVAKLLFEYGFDQEQIDINVAAGAGRNAETATVYADIVAYRDKKRAEPFVVVETKCPKERTGVKQAESYARNLGAEYHVWSNGNTVRFFRTAKYIDQICASGQYPSLAG